MELQKNEYVIGIDLGTTNTCAAIITSRVPNPIVIPYPDGGHLLKSYVRYGEQFEVGLGAYKYSTYGLPGVVKNSKRIIGKYYNTEIVSRCIKENQCGVEIKEVNKKPVFSIDNTTLVSPSDVSSEILKRVIEKTYEFVKKSYGDNMKCIKISVTFPAHFDNNQRTATLLAVEKAGIPKEKLTMLNEPSAAAFYYCKQNKIDNKTILVYDLGGGTFDVSIVKVSGNDYQVLKYAGDPFLGGADFDSRFAKVIEETYKEVYRVPLINTKDDNVRRRYYLRLNSIAEQAKIQLSDFETVDVDLSVFQIQDKNNQDSDSDSDSDSEDEIVIEVSREKLNDCIKDLIDRTMEIVKNCIKECKMEIKDIDRVVLVGGSSRLIMVRDRLRKMFGSEKLSGAINPDEAVACGACQNLVESLHLKDRIVYSLGQKLKGGRIRCLIPYQSILKYISKEFTSCPASDYTKYVNCAVYQGHAKKEEDIERIEDCTLIEEYKLEGYEYAPASEVTFITTYTIDEWGIIHVIEKYKEKNKILLDKYFQWTEPITPMNKSQVNIRAIFN